MKLIVIQKQLFSDLSFEQAFALAQNAGAKLCVMIRPEKQFENEQVRTQCWILNNNVRGRSFYKEHCDKEESWICIIPSWFLERIVGMSS